MGKKKAQVIDYQLIRRRYFNRYKLLALDCFEWINLPKNIESRYIEKALFDNGECAFYKDKEIGYLVLPSSPTAEFNVYNEPLYLLLTGNGYSDIKDIKDCVRILNNDLPVAGWEYVDDFAIRMADVESSIKANIRQQKFPYIIVCDDNTRFSAETMYQNVKDGDPVIYSKKKLTDNDISVLDLNVPFVVDKLIDYKRELENDILSFYGLNNAKDKKERMLVDEVNSNNDYIDRNIELMYKTRKYACKQINDKFGLNVDVIKKNDVFGGDENKVHSGNKGNIE